MKRKRYVYESTVRKTRNLKKRKSGDLEEHCRNEKERIESEFLDPYMSIMVKRRSANIVDCTLFRSIGRGDITIRFYEDVNFHSFVSKVEVRLGSLFVTEGEIPEGEGDVIGVVRDTFNNFFLTPLEYCPCVIIKQGNAINCRNLVTKLELHRNERKKKLNEEKKKVRMRDEDAEEEEDGEGEQAIGIMEDLNGVRVFCGERKEIFMGTLHDFSGGIGDLIILESGNCQQFICGDHSMCEECLKSQQNLGTKDDSIRIDFGEEDDSSEDDEEEEDELVETIRTGISTGKIIPGTKFYKSINEASKMVQRNRYTCHGKEFLHLLHVAISTKVHGNDAISKGKWVFQEEYPDDLSKSYYDGNFILPSDKTVNRVVNYFRVRPGFQMIPKEVFRLLLDAVFEGFVVKKVLGRSANDWMHVKIGSMINSTSGIKFISGFVDYGMKNRRFLKLEQLLQKTRSECEDPSLRPVLDGYFGNHEYMKKKYKLPKKAKKLGVFGFCFTIMLEDDDPFMLYVPQTILFESNVSRQEAKFAIISFLLDFDCYLQELIQNGNKNYEKVTIDCHVTDAEVGVMSFLNEECVHPDESASPHELPYLLRIPRIFRASEDASESFDTVSVNDVEHVSKEFGYRIRESNGVTKCYSWLLRDGEGKGKLVPLTRRPLDELRRFEMIDPYTFKLSKLDESSLNPTNREKQKTTNATKLFCSETMQALKNFRQKFSGGHYMMDKSRLTLDEIDGYLDVASDVSTFYSVLRAKYVVGEVQRKQIEELKDKIILFLDVIQEKSRTTSGLKFSRCAFVETLKRMLKCCNAFLYLYKIRPNCFIPYSCFSDNDIEGLNSDFRNEGGANVPNPTCEDCVNRFPLVILKQQDLNFEKAKRAGSYSFCERISSNNILLENLDHFKELNKEQYTDFEDELDRICDETQLIWPTDEEFEKNDENLLEYTKERFKYIIGYVLKSSMNKCRRTSRVGLSNIMGNFVQMKSTRKVHVPEEKFLHFFWKIDLFMRINLSRIISSGSFVVLPEILIREISARFLSKFSEDVWKELVRGEDVDKKIEEKKIFDVLVETIVRVRVEEVLRNLGMAPRKGVRSFRGSLK